MIEKEEKNINPIINRRECKPTKINVNKRATKYNKIHKITRHFI